MTLVNGWRTRWRQYSTWLADRIASAKTLEDVEKITWPI